MAKTIIEVLGSFKDGMSAGLRKLQTEFQSLGASAAKNFKGIATSVLSMKTAFAGLATFVVAGRITRGISAIVAEGAKLHDTAQALGVTTESLSGLAYALDQAGASADDAGPILSRLSKVMGQVRGGDNREAARAFRELGIRLSEVRDLKADEMFERIMDATQGVADEADRAAIASALLGRGMGEKILPVFAEGAGAVRKFRLEAKELGLTLGADAAKKLDDLDDTMKRLKATVTSTLRDALVEYVPELTRGLNELGFWIKDNKQDLIEFFSTMGTLIGKVASGWAMMPRAFRTVSAYFDTDVDQKKAAENATREWYNMPGSPSDLDRRMGAARKMLGLSPEAWEAAQNAKRDLGGGGAKENKSLSQASEDWQDFRAGFDSAFKEWRAKWMDFGEVGKEAIQKVLVGGMDLLVDQLAAVVVKTKTLKEAFKSMREAVVGELIKIIIKLMIIKALQVAGGLFSGGDSGDTFGFGSGRWGTDETLEKGGIMRGNRIPMRNYGLGGIARGPQLALYGEGSNAEAFVPLPDNRSIPVTLSGGGAPIYNFNIYANDAASFEAQLMRSGGTLMAMVGHGIQTNAGLRGQVKRATG